MRVIRNAVNQENDKNAKKDNRPEAYKDLKNHPVLRWTLEVAVNP